jgi:superfamily I DNA/RNA helicase
MSGNGKRIARGKKTLTGEMFNFDILQREHGLLATKDMIWSEALDRIPDRERAYITALLRRGEKFNAKPRIKLSTIHGTKGGEAENVVLFTDLTSSAIQSSVRGPHPQDIHRVFYVAVTRTKQNLFIVEPENYDRAYII